MKPLLCSSAALMLAALSLVAERPVPVSTPPADEENPRFLLVGEADREIAAGNYEAASARLIEAISICPDCPDNALLLSNLGMVYAYAGRDSLALETLDRALALAPNMRTVLANRARLLLTMGRDTDARDAYSHLLSVDSLNIDGRFYHGMLSLYSSDLQTAEADFAVLRDSLPSDSRTARAMSTLYSMTGRHSQAVPYYRQLVAEEPEPEFYAALASCYLADGMLTEASATIGEAMEKYPDEGELYYCRAWLNKLLFRPSEAKADARTAQSLGISRRRLDAMLNER